MNNLFKSLIVFVFTTNIMGMHAHGGGHMKGNSADWEIETYTTAAPDFIGCLLYTSPSPRDGLLSRMPSSA